ncbi:MAG: MATE family efflux transporter [Halanaerobiaceae bacterium]|nr:MATE family efflux transporter [Halanaerobiaceae bacterium]
MKTNQRSELLGKEKILPLLFRLSIPSIFSMAVQAMYNIVDSIYVARLGTNELAALSVAFPIQMVLISIGVGTGVGTSSLVARCLGMKKQEEAANAERHVIIIAIVYGILGALTGIFLSENLIQLFTSDALLISLGKEYIRIILMGSVTLFFTTIVDNMIRGEGNTVIPMIAMLIGAFTNIILDPFLIYGIGPFPEMGVGGAALATVIARFACCVFLIFILITGRNELQINYKNFRLDISIFKEIYTVGFPTVIMQTLGSIMISLLNLILELYSSTAIAAAGIYFKLQSFVFMPVVGLTHGYLPIMGYNYGHKKPERMKKTMKYTFLTAFSYTTLSFIIFQLFPEGIVRLFNDDPELISIGSMVLKAISLSFPIAGPAIIISTTFQSMGKGLPGLFLSLSRQLIILIPVFALLGKYFGLNGVWYAFLIAELLSFIPAVSWLRHDLKNVFLRMETAE